MIRLHIFLGIIFFTTTSTAFSQVQTNALKKAKRLDRKDTYRKLSDDDRFFLLPQFGMRYGNNPDPNFTGFQDLSLYYGLGLGYRRRNLSLESGLAVYHHHISSAVYSVWERPEYVMNSDLAALLLPFTFRYDIPTGEKENIRFGAYLTSNLSMISLKDDDSKSGTIREGEEQLEYSLTSEAKGPFFFKTGLHAKVRFLNSAFLNLEVGQFFALGTNRLYTLTLDDAPTREVSRKWEGLTWSVGAVVPIAVLEEKFRKRD